MSDKGGLNKVLQPLDKDQRIYSQADIQIPRKQQSGLGQQGFKNISGTTTSRLIVTDRSSLPALKHVKSKSTFSSPSQGGNFFFYQTYLDSNVSLAASLPEKPKRETKFKMNILQTPQTIEKAGGHRNVNRSGLQQQATIEESSELTPERKQMEIIEQYPVIAPSSHDQIEEIADISNYLQNRSINKQGQKAGMKSGTFNNTNSGTLNDSMAVVSFQDKQEYMALRRALVGMLDKVNQLYMSLQLKQRNLDNLIDYFADSDNIITDSMKDFGQIKEMVKGVTESLLNAAKTEVELGSKIRENEKQNIILSQVQKHSQNVIEKNQQLQKNLDMYRQKINTMEEENNQQMKLLNIEKKSNEENKRKVTALEKRVEFILENDINLSLNPSDQLRASLNELLRQNESLKRDLNHKNQHIESLQGNIKKLNFAMSRLNQQIENLKQNPIQKIGGPSIAETNADKEDINLIQSDDVDLLSNYVIPSSLEFRFRGLKAQFSNLLSDVEELGAKIFAETIMAKGKQDQQDDKKEMIKLVGFQFINIRQLSQKMNFLFFTYEKMSKLSTLNELVMSVNDKMQNLFNCNRVNLWIVESQTGCIYTFDMQNNKVKSFFNKGIIGEVFNSKKPLNVKNARGQPLLYLFGDVREKPDVVENTILAPIYTPDKQLRGVLEISNANSEVFGFDDEYFSIVVVSLIDCLIRNITKRELLLYQLRYQNMMFDAFEALMYCQSRFNFQLHAQTWITTIFGMQNVLFYFLVDDQMCQYNSETDIEKFDLNYGLAGLVCAHQKGFIINDVQLSSFFNQLVDLSSILPVYAIPIVDQETNQVLAVVEVTLKTKLQYQEEKDQLIDPSEGYFGFQESVANLFSSFCNLVVLSLQNCQFFQQSRINQNV